MLFSLGSSSIKNVVYHITIIAFIESDELFDINMKKNIKLVAYSDNIAHYFIIYQYDQGGSN